LLALLRAQSVAYRLAEPGHRGPTPLPGRLRLALVAVTVLLWWQIALGGWVSTNYAVLACTEFPTCQGSWWPSMDFREGFTLWRHLGLNSAGEAIPFAALTAIHYVHRLMAFVVLGAMVWLGWRLWRVPGMGRTARALLLLALWQFVSGLTNVVLDWPLLAAVGHTAGAAALVIVFTGALSGTHSAAPRRAEAPGDGALNMFRSTP
ncbi:MAG: COX15/CtaA family protein, partial [Hydrogenophaga sp.]|nr:COX15/CtaA family protein [Hydrogenophaga sp.]